MKPRIPLSVAIITKDEAENLPGCLRSVAFADQIVVVDSESVDDTVQIASACGCEVFEEAWCGFGPQKQLAVCRCRNEWILILDADERLPPETAEMIEKIIAAPPAAAGYSFPRKNYFQGRWIRHAGWWPDRVVRLFRRDCGRLTEAKVHEAVMVDGPVLALDVPIEHFTESRLSEVLKKIDRYSTLAAQEAFAAGRRSTIWGAAFRAKLTFLHDYIIRLGFLDGPQGFTLAMTDAINKFFKYAKIAELRQRKD
ncbi:MAG: glycosyltransferase family 2 protein [Syntrophales bacterium LBB04]|nr:glycosyltransferase family 2 protein [Syntrophales bacterium LBB04]